MQIVGAVTVIIQVITIKRTEKNNSSERLNNVNFVQRGDNMNNYTNHIKNSREVIFIILVIYYEIIDMISHIISFLN